MIAVSFQHLAERKIKKLTATRAYQASKGLLGVFFPLRAESQWLNAYALMYCW
jgi:hypothetical protein